MAVSYVPREGGQWQLPRFCHRKTGFADHVLENMFSNTQEKGTPKTVSDRKPQPGRTRRDYHKTRTTKVTCYSKITPEMRHNLAAENGLFPKCATSMLKSFPNPSPSSKKSPLQRTRGALHLLTLLFLSPHPPTLFCYHNIHPGGSNIAVLQAK